MAWREAGRDDSDVVGAKQELTGKGQPWVSNPQQLKNTVSWNHLKGWQSTRKESWVLGSWTGEGRGKSSAPSFLLLASG